MINKAWIGNDYKVIWDVNSSWTPSALNMKPPFPWKCKVLLNQKCSITSHKIWILSNTATGTKYLTGKGNMRV